MISGTSYSSYCEMLDVRGETAPAMQMIPEAELQPMPMILKDWEAAALLYTLAYSSAGNPEITSPSGDISAERVKGV